jgi:hypothetical protein
MREFCQKPDCTGLVNFAGDPMDGDIGVCEKCGAEHEAQVNIEIVLLDDDDEEEE